MSDKPKEKALTKEERQELRELHDQAIQLIGEDRMERQDGRISNRLELVAAYVTQFKGKLSEEEAEQQAFPLGVMLGAEYCESLKWEWVHLSYKDGFEGFACAARDRSILIFPILNVFKVLADRNQANNIKMNFNLVKNGGGRQNLKSIKPNSYVPLM